MRGQVSSKPAWALFEVVGEMSGMTNWKAKIQAATKAVGPWKYANNFPALETFKVFARDLFKLKADEEGFAVNARLQDLYWAARRFHKLLLLVDNIGQSKKRLDEQRRAGTFHETTKASARLLSLLEADSSHGWITRRYADWRAHWISERPDPEGLTDGTQPRMST